MPSTPCLTERKVVDYLAGALSAADRSAVEAHIAECTVCRRLVAFLARPSQRKKAVSRALESAEGDTQLRPQNQGSGGGLERLSNSHPTTLWPKGTRIGRYVLYEPIGAGSMGVVYEAYDPELDRKVALKLVRAELWRQGGLDDYRARLLREAQALARLSHPNVIAVYDVGTFQQQLFVAMEYIDGLTAARWLKQERRPWREVLRVYIRAARGLAAAHAAGLVHRDFKPDNVMVGRDGRVWVMDFGLARADRTQTGEQRLVADEDTFAKTPVTPSGGTLLAETLTHDGTLVGTPAYMAPEQARDGRADALSDQFSFCVALWEGLYGQRPYRSADIAGWGKDKADTQLKLREPSRTSGVPLWVRRVLLRGLRFDPPERWPSMGAVLNAIDRGRVGTRWAAVAGLALLTFALGAVTMRENERAQRERACRDDSSALTGVWDPSMRDRVSTAFRVTHQPYASEAFARVSEVLDAWAAAWAQERGDACAATRVRQQQSEADLALRTACLNDRLLELQALTELFTHADGSVVERAVAAATQLSPVSGCSDVKSLQTRARPPEDPAARTKVLELRARLSEVKAMRNAGRVTDGLALASAAAAQAHTLGYRPMIGVAQTWLGAMQAESGDLTAAATSLEEAIYACEAGGDLVDLAQAWLELASLSARSGHQNDRAEQAIRHVQAIVDRLAGNGELEVALHRTRAFVAIQSGRPEDALPELQTALAMDERAWGKESDAAARDLAAQGLALMKLSRYHEALAAFDRARQLEERLFGPDHPELALRHQSLGRVHEELGDADEAVKRYREATRILEKSEGASSTLLAQCRLDLARALALAGRYDEAEATARNAHEVLAGPTGRRVDLAASESVEATIAAARGHAEEALSLRRKAVALHLEADGQASAIYARELVKLGADLVAAKRYDEAIETAGRAQVLVDGSRELEDARAELLFVTAQALAGAGKEPDRVRALALQAVARWRGLKSKPSERRADEADRWLQARAR